MLHKQKGYASPILHKFTLPNLINEKSHICNNLSQLNYSSRMNNTLQTKIKPFLDTFLKVQKHPRNENDTAFFLDKLLSSN